MSKGHYQQWLESNRTIKSKLFKSAGAFFLKLKITANRMTFFSFIFGLISMYFLFQNHPLFILFAALHLLADGLDGVLARLTKPTAFGKYFDYFTDRSISLLILVKIYLYLQDYYVILVIFLFVLMQSIYALSRFKYPVVFFRTAGLIGLSFIPLFPPNPFLTLGYLIVGIISLFTLLLQFKYFLRTRMA